MSRCAAVHLFSMSVVTGDLLRRYGRGPRGTRLHGHAVIGRRTPLSPPCASIGSPRPRRSMARSTRRPSAPTSSRSWCRRCAPAMSSCSITWRSTSNRSFVSKRRGRCRGSYPPSVQTTCGTRLIGRTTSADSASPRGAMQAAPTARLEPAATDRILQRNGGEKCYSCRRTVLFDVSDRPTKRMGVEPRTPDRHDSKLSAFICVICGSSYLRDLRLSCLRHLRPRRRCRTLAVSRAGCSRGYRARVSATAAPPADRDKCEWRSADRGVRPRTLVRRSR